MKLLRNTAFLAVVGFIIVLMSNYYLTKERNRYQHEDIRDREMQLPIAHVRRSTGSTLSRRDSHNWHTEMTIFQMVLSKLLESGYVDYSRLITNKTQFEQFMSISTSKVPLASISTEINITLTYPPFSIPLPNFINSSHRDLLINTQNHRQYVEPPSHDRLVGHIVFIPGGMAHSGTDCGWSAPAMLRSNSTCEPCRTLRLSYVQFACPILYMSGGYFQHFLDGNLPKIIQVLPLLTLNPALVLVQPPIYDDIVSEILNKINIPKSMQVFDTHTYLTSKLQINTCVTPPIHPILWESARKLMGVSNRRNTSKVMLVTRAESRNGGRAILNQGDVITLLTSRYGSNFQIFPGRLSLAESLNVYADVRVMIGVHGGGLYNLMFMSKYAAVVEIVPRIVPDTNGVQPEIPWVPIFWGMASVIGQTYWRLYEDASNVSQDVTINTRSLASILDIIDQTP